MYITCPGCPQDSSPTTWRVSIPERTVRTYEVTIQFGMDLGVNALPPRTSKTLLEESPGDLTYHGVIVEDDPEFDEDGVYTLVCVECGYEYTPGDQKNLVDQVATMKHE